MERGIFNSILGKEFSPVVDVNDPLVPITLELPGEWAPGLLPSPRERKADQGPRIKIE